MKQRLLQGGLVVLALLLPAAWMTWSVLSHTTVECEVCIEYRGGRQCRRAEGPDRTSCQRTATDNACAFLASGMSESISCSNTPPARVDFFDREAAY